MICPPEFGLDSLKRNDGANFNCILDCLLFGHAPKVFWVVGVCRKGLVICKDGVFMWDFWNFKVIPRTKTILSAPIGPCHASVLGYEYLQERDGYL